MEININEILKYTNYKVLNRYEIDYPYNSLKANEAFHELLKFMWLNQKITHAKKTSNNMLDFRCAIHEEMKEIDDMWHTFILFTKDYTDFCNYFFGGYIHHEPLDDNSKLSLDLYRADLEKYLSYIYDHLGESTLRKWFNEQPTSKKNPL